MRDLGQLWKDCHTGKIENGMWEYQRKIIIGGVEYNDEDIIDVSFERGLMDRSISFGNAISAKLNATIIPHTDQVVNRNSKVEYYVRVIDLYDNVSSWAKFGEFYIERAENEFNRWSIECYDAMYRAEVNFPKGEYSSTSAINLIANRMNVKIDSRAKPNVTFTVKDAQEYTMREVLGYIAGMSIGSYYITEEGKLKFTKLRINSPVQEILPSNTKKIVGSDKMNFDKVIVKYGSNVDERYEAGSGNREFEVFNPFADSGLAGRMLDFFSNYTFYPGDMNSTEIDPAIELGDTILIDNNGEKLVTNLINIHFSSRMYADVEMPFDTDKFQDSFHFEAVGKDYDDVIQEHEDRLNDHEDRLNLLETLMGIDESCIIVNSNEEAKEKLTPNYRGCLVVNNAVTDLGSKSIQHVKFIGGAGLKNVRISNWPRYSDEPFEKGFQLDLTRMTLNSVESLLFQHDGGSITWPNNLNFLELDKFRYLKSVEFLKYDPGDRPVKIKGDFDLKIDGYGGYVYDELGELDLRDFNGKFSFSGYINLNRLLLPNSREAWFDMRRVSANFVNFSELTGTPPSSMIGWLSSWNLYHEHIDLSNLSYDYDGGHTITALMEDSPNVKSLTLNKSDGYIKLRTSHPSDMTIDGKKGETARVDLSRLLDGAKSLERFNAFLLADFTWTKSYLPPHSEKPWFFVVDFSKLQRRAENIKSSVAERVSVPGASYSRTTRNGKVVPHYIIANISEAFIDNKNMNEVLDMSIFNKFILNNSESYESNPFKGSSIKTLLVHPSTHDSHIEYIKDVTGLEVLVK